MKKCVFTCGIILPPAGIKSMRDFVPYDESKGSIVDVGGITLIKERRPYDAQGERSSIFGRPVYRVHLDVEVDVAVPNLTVVFLFAE